MKRLSIGLLVVLVAAVLPATAAAADPPKTEDVYYMALWEQIQPGQVVYTGAAVHSRGWLARITTVSDDPRFAGYEYDGPGNTNYTLSRWLDPTGTGVSEGNMLIVPTLQPQPDSYWEGHYTCTPVRGCKSEAHGHGAFEGLNLREGLVLLPDPNHLDQLIWAIQGVVVGH